MSMPLTATAQDLAAIGQLRELAPKIHDALAALAQRADDEFLIAYLDSYRTLLGSLVDQTSQILGWIEPERTPTPSVVRKTDSGAELSRRAKLAAGRLKQRYEVADLRAQIQVNRDAGFPTDASERDLDRMRDDRVRLFGENNYIFGLARVHALSSAEWRALADAYRALAQEAQSWARRTEATPEDAARILELNARFEAAIQPCGHALTHDADMDWLISIAQAVQAEESVDDDLATVESLTKAIHNVRPSILAALGPVKPPTNVDRARLKAEVARTKGRLARAEVRDQRDDAAALELRRLQTRHRLEFREDGYIFGFSAAHQLEPEAWEELARAYDDLADALERGVETDENAERAHAAVDRLQTAIAPIGRALRRDDDLDDLTEELRSRMGQRIEIYDPLAPFAEALAGIEDDPTDLARRILAAGVRPSDPRLREPFLEWVEDLDGPEVEPLVRELNLEIERRRQQDEEAEPETPDPDYLEMRNKVREVTRGKRILMVGGGNREETRRAIAAELESAELYWPDSDEHKTKPAAFDNHVDHADLVMKNRFCRRGYQRALERAKAQGKAAVALTGGYSPRQVVRSIAEALRL